MRELKIGQHIINDQSDAFIVCEIGGNHQGSVQTAKDLIKAACECGVSAVKFQRRTLEVWEAMNPEQWHAPYNSEHAFGATYGEHRAALEFGWDEYVELKAYAESLGLLFFATAFDVPSVDFLMRLGVPAIKIASASIVNRPLLEAASATGLPLIVSTGGATMREIDEAVEVIGGRAAFCLAACTAEYPCRAEHMNLRVIPSLRDEYPDTVIGLSDHYNGIALGPVAFALGASVQEKHFTLDRSMRGSDQAFSIEPVGMRKLVRDLHRTRDALGTGLKVRYLEEIAPLAKMGRNSADLMAGVTA